MRFEASYINRNARFKSRSLRLLVETKRYVVAVEGGKIEWIHRY
jgi:hypothetical protein